MKRFDDEFDWHADQKRGAFWVHFSTIVEMSPCKALARNAARFARMVDRLLEVLRRSFLDPFAYRERDD
jgi:hypothetical protein